MTPFHARSTAQPEWSFVDRAIHPPVPQPFPRRVICIGGIASSAVGGSARLTVRRTWWRFVWPRALRAWMIRLVYAR